jgi:hypothetical protein
MAVGFSQIHGIRLACTMIADNASPPGPEAVPRH